LTRGEHLFCRVNAQGKLKEVSTTAKAPKKPAAPEWTPASWKDKPIEQLPDYPDLEAVEKAAEHLSTLPPLVTSWEIERLRGHLAEAAEGKRFVLQGGDCAETFAGCNSAMIANKLKILLQMSLVLLDGLRRPIVRVGRFAGQYAKPRSKAIETRGDLSLPSYYGDLINSSEFTEESRTPDPDRMVTAYHHAAMTLNFIRALIDGGFTDLHHPELWDLNFLGKGGMTFQQRADYLQRVHNLENAIQVMEVFTGQHIDKLSQVEFYSSHEGLSLYYESGLTRQVPRRSGYYDLGCHLPWIGERTRRLDGAHVEFFRGIRNPIGVKLGPKTTPEDVVALADALDPDCEKGRLVFIARLGAGNVRKVLPRMVEAIQKTDHKPVWICDPMHANTVSTSSGLKTRRVDAILDELVESIHVHQETGPGLGGVHFELTAEDVTECVGGASGVTEEDLSERYQSLCDPRLNYEQAMEIAFSIARSMERR